MALVPEFSLWSGLISLPVPFPGAPRAVAVWLLVFTAAAFAAYLAAIGVSMMNDSPRRVLLAVAGVGLLFSFVNVWSLPNLNTDIFNYIMNGRVAAVYGQNPYAVAADEFPDDPIYPYASQRYTAVGGDKLPVWMALNVVLARVSGNNPVTNLLTYRLALFMFNAANLGLVLLIMRARSARHALTAVVLYAWNPVIILFAQSKTDTVMAFFVLLGAWALIARRRWFVALAFLLMSVMVKLITLPLLAIVMLRSIRLKRWTEVASGALTAVALLGLGALLIQFLEPDLLSTYLFWFQAMGPSESDFLGGLILVGFVALVSVVGLFQNGDDQRLMAGWTVVMLYLVFLIADFTRAWYLITVVAVAALAVDWHLSLLLVGCSLVSFVFNFWNATFTSEFASPDFIDVQRPLLLIALVGSLVAYFVAVFAWRRGREIRAPN